MITLTKIDGRKITVNAEEIEMIETTHDSTLSLKSGKKIIVKENCHEIIDKVIRYRRKCFTELPAIKRPEVN